MVVATDSTTRLHLHIRPFHSVQHSSDRDVLRPFRAKPRGGLQKIGSVLHADVAHLPDLFRGVVAGFQDGFD